MSARQCLHLLPIGSNDVYARKEGRFSRLFWHFAVPLYLQCGSSGGGWTFPTAATFRGQTSPINVRRTRSEIRPWEACGFLQVSVEPIPTRAEPLPMMVGDSSPERTEQIQIGVKRESWTRSILIDLYETANPSGAHVSTEGRRGRRLSDLSLCDHRHGRAEALMDIETARAGVSGWQKALFIVVIVAPWYLLGTAETIHEDRAPL